MVELVADRNLKGVQQKEGVEVQAKLEHRGDEKEKKAVEGREKLPAILRPAAWEEGGGGKGGREGNEGRQKKRKSIYTNNWVEKAEIG